MSELTLSSTYQIVIPREIREALGLQPGQKIQAIRIGKHIALIPVKPLADTEGILRGKGIPTNVTRDRD